MTFPEEQVQEAFAASLGSLMFYFFSRCPLIELSAAHQLVKLSPTAEVEATLTTQLKEAASDGVQARVIVSEQGLKVVRDESDPMNQQNRKDSMLSARSAFNRARDVDQDAPVTPSTGSTLVDPSPTASAGTAVDGHDGHDDQLHDRQ